MEKGKFLKVSRASEILGLPRASVYALIKSGRIPAHKFSKRRTRIHEADLKNFIETSKA